MAIWPSSIWGSITYGVGRERIGAFESRQTSKQRPGSRRDEGAAIGQRPPARDEQARPFEASPPGHDVDTLGPQALRSVVHGDASPGLAHSRHDAHKMDLALDRREPDLAGRTHAVGQLGGGRQPLAGPPAGPRSLAARTVALDEHDAGPEAGGADRRDQAGAAAAQDRELLSGPGSGRLPHPGFEDHGRASCQPGAARG